MQLHEALQLVKFDKRLIEWHLKQGIITQAEVDKFNSGLKDDADRAVTVDIEADDDSSDSFYTNGQ